MKHIKISNKSVGAGKPCFIIAEAGVNHNGKFHLAKRMIDIAKNAGADAVKFQVFSAKHVVVKTVGSQYRMLKKLELTRGEFSKLASHAKKKNIIFLGSAFDKESVDLLNELKVPAFKIPSGEITNFPLLEYIAAKEKPIILSTGMSTLGEIETALTVIRKGTEDIILLHCVSNYPAKVEEINLRTMRTMGQVFRLPIGLSDHTIGITVPIAAAALEAAVIEKHFTLDKTLPGPDHRASLEPGELREMVKAIRNVERALGGGVKKPTKSEEKIKEVTRRSVVAKVNIPARTFITRNMLDVKRPGVGIGPEHLNKIIRRRAKRNIKKDELLSWAAIGE